MYVNACVHVYTYVYTQSYSCPDHTNLGTQFSVHSEVSVVHLWHFSMHFTKHWNEKKLN